jgi:adenosine deaminase
MTDEFLIAHQALGFSWDQLCELTLMGFQSAFLPYKDKAALVAAVEAEIGAVTAAG